MIPFIDHPHTGRWYLSATCNICGYKLLIFNDLNDGHGSVAATVFITCPKCHESQTLALEHYQHSDRRVPAKNRELAAQSRIH